MVGQVQHVFSSPFTEDAGVVTVFNSSGGSVTQQATSLIGPSEWNSPHNQTVTLSGNTLNASTVSGTNIILSATGGISLSGNANTIVLTAATVPAYTLSAWGAPQLDAAPISFQAVAGAIGSALANSSIYFAPFTLPAPLSLTCVQIPVSYTRTSSAASTTNNVIVGAAIYTLTGSTYSLVTSANMTMSFSESSSSFTITVTGGLPAGSTSFSTTNTSIFTAAVQQMLQIPLGTTVPAGVPALVCYSRALLGGGQAMQELVTAVNAGRFGFIGTNQGSAALSSTSAYDRLIGGVFNITSANAFPASISTSGLQNLTISQVGIIAQMLAS